MKIVGIDIGYHNLGLVTTEINDDFIPVVTYCKRVNITNIRCPGGCNIPHTNEVADLVAHFIKEYSEILNLADTILL
jgi:hypothetical protein